MWRGSRRARHSPCASIVIQLHDDEDMVHMYVCHERE